VVADGSAAGGSEDRAVAGRRRQARLASQLPEDCQGLAGGAERAVGAGMIRARYQNIEFKELLFEFYILHLELCTCM
jgi:hypothetical protein